mmetsp:Transcript_13621/g.11394  ORF Transcript_13621/g.11394 Transcript_13621/m.11394 type:complete len:93 (+) Transcript_13621:313-591(+)
MFDKNQVTKLWVHESERIFSDRLLENDLVKFNEIITDVLKRGFGDNYKTTTNNGMLIFGNFCPVTVKIDGNDKKLINKYAELKDMPALKLKC